MSNETNHQPAEKPTQAIFIGWMSVGLIALMAVFAIFVLSAGL